MTVTLSKSKNGFGITDYSYRAGDGTFYYIRPFRTRGERRWFLYKDSEEVASFCRLKDAKDFIEKDSSPESKVRAEVNVLNRRYNLGVQAEEYGTDGRWRVSIDKGSWAITKKGLSLGQTLEMLEMMRFACLAAGAPIVNPL